MQILHNKSLTMADSSDTSLVRPSDWNSLHLVGVALSGNTLGSSFVTGSSVVLNAGANITLSGDTLNSQVVISGVGGGVINQTGPNIAAGGVTVTSGTVVFSNSNGVSFGLNASTMTASVQTAYAGLNSAVTNATVTMNSSGISFDGRGYAGTNTAITGGSMTLNSSGLTVSLPAYLTTAAQSTQTLQIGVSNTGNTAGNTGAVIGSSYVLAGSGSITLSQSTAVGGATAWMQHPAWITTARASTDAVGLNSAQSNVTWTVNSSGISLDARGYAGTNTSFGGTNISGSMTLNSSGLTLSLSGGAGGGGGGIAIADSANTISNSTVVFSNANSISFGLNGSTMTASYQPPSLSRFVPYELDPFRSNTSGFGGFNTLQVFPVIFPANQTFGQINMIVSASNASTTAPNTIQMSASNGSSMGLSYQASVTAAVMQDIYLFTKGTGVFSTNLNSFASTEQSLVTFQTMTYRVSETGGAVSGTFSLLSSYSQILSVPGLISGTATSINAGSTYTSWQIGYMSITGSTTASTSNSAATVATFSSSLVGAFPSTTMFTSYQMVPFAFATSLSQGEYWLGIAQRSSSSSSSASTGGNLAAGNSLSFTISGNVLATQTSQRLSYMGMTSSIAGSLGWLGSGTAATMAPPPGLGTFTATYTGNATYVNNMGQAAGVIAFSQIQTVGSFWRPWIEFASIRI